MPVCRADSCSLCPRVVTTSRHRRRGEILRCTQMAAECAGPVGLFEVPRREWRIMSRAARGQYQCSAFEPEPAVRGCTSNVPSCPRARCGQRTKHLEQQAVEHVTSQVFDARLARHFPMHQRLRQAVPGSGRRAQCDGFARGLTRPSRKKCRGADVLSLPQYRFADRLPARGAPSVVGFRSNGSAGTAERADRNNAFPVQVATRPPTSLRG